MCKTPLEVYRYHFCCRLNKKNFPLSKYDHNITWMSAGQVKTVNRYIEDLRDMINLNLGDFSSFHPMLSCKLNLEVASGNW